MKPATAIASLDTKHSLTAIYFPDILPQYFVVNIFYLLLSTAMSDQPHQSFLRKWGALIIMSLALAIIIIDTTLLNVSLGVIIRDLHTNIQSLQWVITAYALALAALTITGGRLGDLFGRKKMFITGAAIFALGSFVASISHNVPTLLIGESIIEGIGAALMMPATASLLLSSFRGHDRAIAFGVWGGIAAAASAIGPILGGYLTTHFSWRWGFRINIVVAAILIIGSVLVHEYRDEKEKPTLDIIGVILSALGLLGFIFGIIESSTYGWWTAKQTFMIGSHAVSFGSLSVVPISIVVGLIFIGLFLWWQKVIAARGRTPLVSLSLFRNRQFVSGMMTMAVQSLAMTGLIFVAPVFLQAVRKLDALHTGLALLLMSIALLITAPLGAVLSRKIVPKYLIQAGLLISAVGGYILWRSITVDATPMDLAPGFIVFGAGMGFVMAQISNLTLSAVSVQQAGEAAGVNNTFRQIGSSLGSAIVGAILLTSLATNVQSQVNASTTIPNNVKPALLQSLATQQSNIEFGNGAQLPDSIPANVGTEIQHIAAVATTQANRDALMYTLIFSGLALLVSIGLPGVRNLDRG